LKIFDVITILIPKLLWYWVNFDSFRLLLGLRWQPDYVVWPILEKNQHKNQKKDDQKRPPKKDQKKDRNNTASTNTTKNGFE